MHPARLTLAALLALGTCNALAQDMVLFEYENFQGRHFGATASIGSLDPTGFNDRASSVQIRGGSWQLCSEAYFRGQCITLVPGNYQSLSAMGLDKQVSSLRETGWTGGPGPGLGGGSGSGGGGGGPRVVLFEGDDFQGRSVTLENVVPNFDPLGFNDRARSVIVQSGNWQLCSDAFFQGDCRSFGPGRYANLGGVAGQTSSARPLGGGGGTSVGGVGGGGGWGGGGTRVVLYEGTGFTGRSFVLNNDYLTSFDGVGFNDRASSIRVERGYWMFCSDANFRGECRTFGPGDYPSLQNGLNNRISSARKISNDYPYQQPPTWGGGPPGLGGSSGYSQQ